MPYLFCNIGWMERYEGLSGTKDEISGGGEYVQQYGHGAEVCNFLEVDDGLVYGHVETIKGETDRTIKVTKLGAAGRDFADQVDVIWTATHPHERGRRVTGWYRNARVYAKRQQDRPSSRQHRRDKITSYRVVARAADVTLLPSDERTLILGRGPGWIGQANWWFPNDTNEDVRDFLTTVSRLMAEGAHEQSEVPRLRIQERASYRLHKRLERNPDTSAAVKGHHGFACQACDFDFEARFGEIGKGFIEAHHLKPLSRLKPGQTRKYDVAKDFAVLCSNCHRMVHRMDDPSDLNALRLLIRQFDPKGALTTSANLSRRTSHEVLTTPP